MADQDPNAPKEQKSSEEERLQAFQREEERLKALQKLQVLEREAYHDVLLAFKAESLELSQVRSTIMEDLKKEWNITEETLANFELILESAPLVQHLKRKAEKKRKLGAITEKSTSEYSPESFIGKRVHIRLSDGGEYIPFEYIPFDIKGYNAEEKSHHLVDPSSPKNYVDPCDWIDIEHLPSKDVLWPGEDPEFNTTLWKTKTARNKKPLPEYGKSESGIPILSKPEDRQQRKAMALDSGNNANPTIYIPAVSGSWEPGAAESLIGKHLRLIVPGEEAEDFVITAYDAEKEEHYIKSTDPNAMEMDPLWCNIDLREHSPQEIEWKDVRTDRR